MLMFCFALIRYETDNTNRMGGTWDIVKKYLKKTAKQAYISLPRGKKENQMLKLNHMSKM